MPNWADSCNFHHPLPMHTGMAVVHEPRLIWKSGNDHRCDALRPEDATPAIIADIRARFARMVRKQDLSRLVDVTPGNSVRLGFVNRVFPDCKIVHFIRDELDNGLSMRRFYAVVARTMRLNTPGYRDSAMARRAAKCGSAKSPPPSWRSCATCRPTGCCRS